MCDHKRVLGDNYGMTCQECGEPLAGYGYGGWFGSLLGEVKACIHVFINGACLYCEMSEEQDENQPLHHPLL